jgi:hypothetical protein
MKSLLVVLGILLSFKSLACSCEYGGSFLKMSPHTPLVSLVKVSKFLSFRNINGQKTPISMEVEIIDTFRGKEKRKSITVWGDTGNLCRPYLTIFKEDEYYVIAFTKAGNTGYEKDTDYTISICGAYWLSVDKKSMVASGDIDSENKKLSTMLLKTLKAKLNLESH